MILYTCISEVCAGLRFVSGSRQGVEISARLPGDFQYLVPAWSRGMNFCPVSARVPGHYCLVPACPSRPGIRESRIWSSINQSYALFKLNLCFIEGVYSNISVLHGNSVVFLLMEFEN